MRLSHALVLTAALMSFTLAAFAQAPTNQQAPAQQPPAQQVPSAKPPQPEGAAIHDLLVGAKEYRWVRMTAEGMATLTFDPSGKFATFVLLTRSPLNPTGGQTECRGNWSVSGRSITFSKRTCRVGQGTSDPNPDYTAEVVSIDADNLVLKFEEGATFEFKAQH